MKKEKEEKLISDLNVDNQYSLESNNFFLPQENVFDSRKSSFFI